MNSFGVQSSQLLSDPKRIPANGLLSAAARMIVLWSKRSDKEPVERVPERQLDLRFGSTKMVSLCILLSNHGSGQGGPKRKVVFQHPPACQRPLALTTPHPKRNHLWL